MVTLWSTISIIYQSLQVSNFKFLNLTFNQVFAQSFIHLFPKDKVLDVFRKMFTLIENNGFLHFSTTIHNTSSEGFEEKEDYNVKVKRFRKVYSYYDN